jgi:signal transduction histidine kinase/ActR/RegA family two-component response regulator
LVPEKLMIITLILLGVSLAGLIILLAYHLRFRQTQLNAMTDVRSQNAQLKTSYVETQNALREAITKEAWYRMVLDTESDLVFSYTITEEDLPFRFWEMNDAAIRSLEFSREELLNLSPMDVETSAAPGSEAMQRIREAGDMPLGQRDSFAAQKMQMLVRRILREGRIVYESTYITKSGRMIPVEVNAVRLDLSERVAIVCIARDTTDRTKLQIEAVDRKRMIHDLIQLSPIALVFYNGRREVSEASPSCLKMFGMPDASDLKKFNLLDNAFVPAAARESMKRGEYTRFEMALNFTEAMSQGLFTTSRQGIGYFDVMMHNRGADSNFLLRGFLVQILDITALRTTESLLSARERMLQQAQKLEAIGTFAGGIAHDFNNILSPIMGYAELATDKCTPGEEMHEFLQQIVLASQRAKRLVEQILLFSRQKEDPRVPIGFVPIVKEIVKQLTASAPPGIEIQHTVKTDRDLILATPTQIHQILMNLGTNAIYSMREKGGILDIRLTSFVLSRHHKHEFPQLVTSEYLRSGEQRRYLRLTVRDSGSGMSPETVGRIFEPFFTTKPAGSGTGMGLPVVQSIVSGLGGAISVESELGKGSSFQVAFPLVEPAEEAAKDRETVAPQVALARILFVDNEVEIIRMASFMLKSLGYEAVTTSESREALKLFRQDPEGFDLVITDQVMPEMSGSELSKELLAIRPDIPIILCTGFIEKVTPEEIRAIGVRELLFKPVERRDLSAAINRVLAPLPPRTAGDTALNDGTEASQN